MIDYTKFSSQSSPLAPVFCPELCIVEARDGYFYDEKGKAYIDFSAGIAVNSIGYNKLGEFSQVIAEQASKLVHTSNLFTNPSTLALAERLRNLASQEFGYPFVSVLFSNSGTEANEAALKFARFYSTRKYSKEKIELLSCSNAFHGRTMGALSVTPQKKYKEDIEPLVSGCKVLPYDDGVAVKEGTSSHSAGFIIEPIQGEGGLHMLSKDCATVINEQCHKHDITLIADEIQTGLMRTGTWFASTQIGLKPDIVTLAKPLAGGLPLGAVLITKKIHDVLRVGDHGSTFAGGPVSCAGALYVLDTVGETRMQNDMHRNIDYLNMALERLCEQFPQCETRGQGLLRGLALPKEVAEHIPDIFRRCIEEGLVLLRSGTDCLRITPPFDISTALLDKGFDILSHVLSSYFSKT